MLSPTSPFDAHLSAQLNDVPLPADLLSRLRMIPVASDRDLDAAMADVNVPSDLTGRLSTVGLDVCSTGLAARSIGLPMVRRAAAALVMFCVGFGYLFSVTALVAARYELPHAGEPLCLAWSGFSGESGCEESWVTLDSALGDPSLGNAAPTGGESSDGVPARQTLDIDTDTDPGRRLPRFDRPASGEPAMMGEQIALAEFADQAVATSPFSVDDLNALSNERSTVHIAGIDGDMRVEKEHTLARVDVAAHPTFELDVATDDASYRDCVRAIESGRLPRPQRIRVEEFLAAFDYGFVSRTDGTPLMLAAAPSPFEGPSLKADASESDRRRWLVMVGVDLGDESRSALTHLRLTFSPEWVKAYRILGYGVASDTGVAGPSDADELVEQMPSRRMRVLLVEIDLSRVLDPGEGDSARNGLPDTLGRVRLDRRYARGEGRTTETVLSSRSFANDLESAPLALRQAALVALAAENLAGSPFAEHVSLAEIVVSAKRLEPLLDDRNDWREFIEMIDGAQSVRSFLLRAF